MYCNKRTLLIISLTRDEANCGHRSQGNSEYIFKDLYLITNSRNRAKRKRLMCKYNFILGTIWLLLVCSDTSLTLVHLAKDFWLKMLDFFFFGSQFSNGDTPRNLYFAQVMRCLFSSGIVARYICSTRKVTMTVFFQAMEAIRGQF